MLAVTAGQERASKLELVAQLLFGLGLHGAEPQLVASPSRTEYRNRIRLRIDEHSHVAFFNSDKSPSCAVLTPALREYVNHLRELSHANPRAFASCAHLEARTRDNDGKLGLFLTERPQFTISAEALAELALSYSNQTITTNTGATTPSQRFSIDATTYQRVPLDGFLQVNFAVNQQLTQHVVNKAKARDLRTFADLYCGSGNFALPLGHAGLSGLGVERVQSSITCAQIAAREQGLVDVHFEPGDSIEVVKSYSKSAAKFDFVLIDPPRAGVRVGLDAIAELARKSIAYCSCNPETLERDVAFLITLGWNVDRVTAFDMFPGTRHLEVVVWLSR